MNTSPSQPSVLHGAEKTSVYALLIGINAYDRFPLRGPVKDVGKMTEFLNSLPDIDLNLQILLDEKATKEAIVEGFRQHLGRAQSADTVLFYFSGHGTIEQADTEIWTDEPDGRLSTVVCYNGGASASWDYLLTDKELRYLLNDVTRQGTVHTVALFDCCHSGDNTRSLLDFDEQISQERSIAEVFPQRPWSAFLFSDQILEEQARSLPVNQWLPEPVHIQMAACESDEKALEVNEEGVFTKNLLTVLAANGGAVSYGSLIDRARQYMRFGYDQRPRLFVPGQTADSLKRSPFLNRQVQAELPMVQAQFSPDKQAWVVNVGALHGLQPGQSVSLLSTTGQPLLTMLVADTGLDYAQLRPDAAAAEQPDPALVYQVSVPGLVSKPLRIFFASRNGSPAEQARLITALVDEANGCYVPEENEAAADYAIYVRNGWYFLTRPNSPTQPDNEYRPLARPIALTDSKAMNELGGYIRQLSHWEYLKTLHNPVATGPGIRVEVRPENENPVVVPAQGDDPTVDIPLIERNDAFENNLVIRVTNTTKEVIYGRVVYLTYGIGAMLQFLDNDTMIRPGETVVVGQDEDGAGNATRTSILLSSFKQNVVHDYNWPSVDERLLFIFTTKSENASGQLSTGTLDFLQFDELPIPPTLADRVPGDHRAIAATRPSMAKPLPSWWTQSVNLRWQNPAYNKISKEALQTMIEPRPDTPADDALADCALGLYFTLDSSNPSQPKLQVKPELQTHWEEHPGERGFFEDVSLELASRVSQSIRNRQFRESRLLYPNRPRIVATGDSWFQYPFLIRDIVDYLANGNLVYSLATAGQTLKSIEATAILDAIEEADAQFLLFSGGLNDIMNSFTDQFVRDAGSESQLKPHQYLTSAFFQALDTMQAHYESLFEAVRREKPDVKVIAHGYDYIRSVNSVSADRNWLAPQLSRKGITSPSEQQELLNAVIDEYNGRIQRATERVGGVQYLDLRKMVPNPGYWHDEIHPNDKGFMDLAYGFAKLIRSGKQPIVVPAN